MSSSKTPGAASRRLKLCLAASGGGHVRQLLDLEPVWSQHDYFFVTEQTALGESLAGSHRSYFLPHFAWGQTKMGASLRMVTGAFKSLLAAWGVMWRERPDVVISTGAGAVFFPVVFGRLLGARIVVIESFARFDHPSLFGRLAAPFAHEMVVQSAKLSTRYPKARVFDPLRDLGEETPAKEALLFATVGATLPFDRLSNSIGRMKAEGVVTEHVILQTGVGGTKPEGLENHDTLPFEQIQSLLKRASIVVCHGGTGSLITALREGCHVIAMPRLSALGEHYDDHQSEITLAFAARGLIQVARTEDELREALLATTTRKRVRATTDPQALISFLNDLLSRVKPRPRANAASVAFPATTN